MFDRITRQGRVDTGFVSQRGELPQALRTRAHYVVSEPDLKLWSASTPHSGVQGMASARHVETLAEALQRWACRVGTSPVDVGVI